MKTFGAAIGHMLSVVCAPLYWLLSFVFVWAGLILLGRDPGMGWAVLGLPAALLAFRIFLVPGRISPKLANLIGCAIFIGVVLGNYVYTQSQQKCGIATFPDGHEEPVCL